MRDKLGKRKVYAKRNKDGTFKDIQSIKRAMVIDKAKQAKSGCKPGNCDMGDRERMPVKKSKLKQFFRGF